MYKICLKNQLPLLIKNVAIKLVGRETSVFLALKKQIYPASKKVFLTFSSTESSVQ